MAIIACHSKNFWHYTPGCSVHVLDKFKRHALSYHKYLYHSTREAYKASRPIPKVMDWRQRLLFESTLAPSARNCVPLSVQSYAPSVRELLRGLWSLSKDPIWLLVDQLVATGRPYDMTKTCPEFPQWQHIVDAPNLLTAISSLAAQGHIVSPKFKEEDVDDISGGDHSRKNGLPTWLAMYLVSAKIDTRAAAHAGVVFSLSLLGNITMSFRAPLLLLSMCGLSEHGLKSQFPIILQAFQDVFTVYDPALGSRDAIVYQYNVFLTLVSRFSLVPQLATHVDRLLRLMHVYGVPLETTTATQLISPRQTAPFLVYTVRHILETQTIKAPNALAISLTRYFSKSRNQREAIKHMGIPGMDPLAQAKTYLLSFRDIDASLAYLRTVEARRHHAFKTQHILDNGHILGPAQRNLATSTPDSLLGQQAEVSQTSTIASRHMRQIYTSMLFAAALNKSISIETFCAMTNSIRIAHGADKVLETVALMGLLRRRAWNQAREVWNNWEAKSVQLLHTAHHTDAFLERREKTFGDAAAVRETLRLTEFESHVLRRTAYRMKVDSTALALIVRAVAGSDTAGLLKAFDVMDGYAIKTDQKLQMASDVPADDRFRPHDVRLTSRVLNCFLLCSFNRRRPDIIFRFWDGATPYYGVEASVPTLELLLRSARLAVSMEQPLVNVFPHWLLRGTFRDDLHMDTFPDFGEDIRWMLSPQCRPGTRWNGRPAWRVARRVFREDIIFVNWPWLRDIHVPARPVVGDAATSRLDALQELSMGDVEVAGVGRYPHLMPRARTFREYILLLSRVQRSSEIPQVLAWMRALKVYPSRHMLSLCLALWSEVGVGPPLDDMWVERCHSNGEPRHGGEYGKLVIWLEEWIGKDGVPNDAEAMESLKYIRELEQKERSLR